MSSKIDRYEMIIEVLDSKQRKYIHYKSLKNFIIHLSEIESIGEMHESEKKINEYLDIVEQNINKIDGTFATLLFTDYLYPLGDTYRKIGFKEITPLKNSLSFAFLIDLIVGLFFLNFPYPILTAIVLINFYLKQKYYNSFRVFGMFY